MNTVSKANSLDPGTIQQEKKPSVSVLILTYNEEKHIARCIKSIQSFARNIYIVDSFSTDRTIEIAEELGAVCYKKKWENNYALQFNWGLTSIGMDTKWVMRLDADEYVQPELAREIKEKMDNLDEQTIGININRRVVFMDKWIKRGGYYPTTLLRIWRNGAGLLEQRWMDEHVKLGDGNIIAFSHDIVDHNLNNLTWWTNKHNNYATREVLDFLIYKYDLNESYDSISKEITGTQDKRKRWFKEKIYFSIPLFVRPFFYFVFRYFFKLGFLDGKQGLIWHFLQGFWYRFLVDAKVYEIYRNAGREKEKIRDYLQKEYNINL